MTKIKKEKRSIKKIIIRIGKGNTMYQNERLGIKILLIQSSSLIYLKSLRKDCTTNRYREDELLMVDVLLRSWFQVTVLVTDSEGPEAYQSWCIGLVSDDT